MLWLIFKTASDDYNTVLMINTGAWAITHFMVVIIAYDEKIPFILFLTLAYFKLLVYGPYRLNGI